LFRLDRKPATSNQISRTLMRKLIQNRVFDDSSQYCHEWHEWHEWHELRVLHVTLRPAALPLQHPIHHSRQRTTSFYLANKLDTKLVGISQLLNAKTLVVQRFRQAAPSTAGANM